ncbi:MAG: DNA-directed RNA polymerase [Candidatus Thermoplasmatota archaeon]|jgi:CxxC-x17-CxxC domain-containing protein|nr:DNA-directed RNA polymerase [Euryarchaeota archaeon]MBU4031462.1 DNA-directed RNA polymerase [Candidatus Thermoplasmatota archaeon]MBU4070614.1 DNA-directed RNA polymerase [Candidatus Thermoplasmatota archaeon]MBU4143441.1 DNA-directed RNA polymerase [Candidatus Thermoplasmatota archaeon]MBU4592631.1 DNA-directed RNA polymerase [Candidatus Thermoplasmatota archaeon]
MYNSDREMHKATCADCKKECEVPFKPSEDRPVYCRDCFQKHRPPRRDRY